MPHSDLPGPFAALLLALWAANPVCVRADAVYKSVDAEGRVTYSSAPPPVGSARQVQELRIQPGPAAADTNAADQRLRALPEGGQDPGIEQAAAATQRQGVIATAQQELIRAKAELEQAKIQGDGDWQDPVGGGRVLSESYFKGVADAEAGVEAAEKALQRARQGR
ncbi:MAG: hypothetical protein H6R22_69 [Chromatiaceae bacterium]|nr:hypothetical protein [Chromatiaceae bacterium]